MNTNLLFLNESLVLIKLGACQMRPFNMNCLNSEACFLLVKAVFPHFQAIATTHNIFLHYGWTNNEVIIRKSGISRRCRPFESHKTMCSSKNAFQMHIRRSRLFVQFLRDRTSLKGTRTVRSLSHLSGRCPAGESSYTMTYPGVSVISMPGVGSSFA